jgi:competence ComEA-like helix-hairpin-helix protein
MSLARSAVCLAALVLASHAVFAQDVVLPDGKAKKLIEDTCSECHGLEQVVNNPMSSESWRNTVKSMARKGAKLTPDEIDTVVEYLTVYFAPEKVNVNTAGPKELQNSLNFSDAEAAAILQFRKANGNFKDIAALLKVPGVDAKKVESKKDQIVF